MTLTKVSRIVHSGKEAYDQIYLDNGTVVALRYHPFYSGTEAYTDVAIDKETNTLHGRVVIQREITAKSDGMYVMRVSTKLAGERREGTYPVSESQYFHPKKDALYRLIIKTLFGG